MLCQSLRALIDLANFALFPVAAKEPVILESSYVLLFRLPYIEKKLEESLEIRVILPKDLCSISFFSEKNRKKIEVKVSNEIKVSVIVSEIFSMLELPGQDGKIDQNTAIFGYDDKFRE